MVGLNVCVLFMNGYFDLDVYPRRLFCDFGLYLGAGFALYVGLFPLRL